MNKWCIKSILIPAMLLSFSALSDELSRYADAHGYAGGERMTKRTFPSSKMAADDYWTPERMAKARPYPLPVVKGVGQLRTPSAFDEMPGGTPGSDIGNLPTGDYFHLDSEDSLPEQFPSDSGVNIKKSVAQQLAAVLPAYNPLGSPIHVTYSVPPVLYASDSALYPYSAIGKVFFTGADGRTFVCSGAAIGNRAVLTAGHCVVENDQYHTNWSFVPGFYHGNRPYGTWKAESAVTFDAWREQGDFARDVAFVIVENQEGRTLSQTVGSLSFSWNQPRQKLWAEFGYPAVSPYSGIEMIQTLAPTAGIDDEFSPPATGIGTIQTQGSSGGPWIIDFSPGLVVSNFANGVVSYSLSDLPDMQFSPYFDDAVKAAKDQAVAE
ncbi:MAG: trypsin-like serine protease [Gammaproteobacteria bacterium]|nr:trypsin-like serine protease [Gammaproteobacteria bacterium]MCP5196353.1 trypsin-like serine protease [Gammaproteobacteria bacterium]